MVFQLDPSNGSHWDVLVTLPILFVVLVGYWRYRRLVKRKRMEGYEDRRREWQQEIFGPVGLGTPWYAHIDDSETVADVLYREAKVEDDWEPEERRVYDQERDADQ